MQKRVTMDKETRELLAKLFTSQLKELADEKGIDCGESPDRIDYLSILGKSKKIQKDDVEHFIVAMETKKQESVEGEEYFGEVEKVLKDYKSDGTLFEEGSDLLKKMQSNFREGNLENTISRGVSGAGLIEDLSIRFEMVRRAYVIYAFRQLIADVKDSGIDVGDVEEFVLSAAEHFHAGETEELDGVLEDISKRAKELQSVQAEKLKEMIADVEEFIDQSRDLGVESEEARDLLHKAEAAFESKTYKKVGYYASKAKKSAETAREDRIRGISDALLFVKTILEDTREIGADVSEVEELYEDAKVAFEDKKYMKCKTLIKEVEQTALERQDAQIKKAMQLRKRREPDEVDAEVVEVEAEVVASRPRRAEPRYARPSRSRYQPPIAPQRSEIPAGMRKTRCPNCGQSFPVKAKKGPQRIECPHCGMRGMMP
jgi:DNA-directed RNA polymerase subunit RPC12/RpoP